jgi:hypothetical protein
MAEPLCSLEDIEDAWRPLTDEVERTRALRLIVKASAQLRQRRPNIDARLLLPADDPMHLDWSLVADVVATAVKDFLVNPGGIASTTETVGPYSQSQSYASRSDSDPRGVLLFDEVSLSKLDPVIPSVYGSVRLGTPWWYPETVPTTSRGDI